MVFCRLFNETGAEQLRQTALKLIDSEPDPKYRRKVAGVWRPR
jgi:hypothetical protein